MPVNRGRKRFVLSVLTPSLSCQVENLHEEIDNNEDTEDHITRAPYNPDPSNDFLFSFDSAAHGLNRAHPSPIIIDRLWETYVTNFDPMMKVVHKPTAWLAISEAKVNLMTINEEMEALMFAIYYAAIITLKPHEILDLFQKQPEEVLSRHQLLVEQALARAGIIQSQDLLTLQAFIIYLNCQLCTRKHDDTRSVWRLTGLAIRIGQSLGLHRDGIKFNLAPFDVEMRRRIWWQVFILEVRAADDHGSDPALIGDTWDTELPTNINDEDFGPDSIEIPPSRKEHTEMTFGLLRCEVSRLLYRLLHIEPPAKFSGLPRLKGQVEIFESWKRQLEEKYVEPFDTKDPLQIVTINLCKLILAKIWLVIHHPLIVQCRELRKDPILSEQTRDSLFVTSRKLIEHSLKLEESSVTSRWNWYFKTYFPWHAVIYILTELSCSQRKIPDDEKAWILVQTILSRQSPAAILKLGNRGHVWQLLARLMSRVSDKRRTDLRKKISVAADQEIPAPPQQYPWSYSTLEQQQVCSSISKMAEQVDTFSVGAVPNWDSFDSVWKHYEAEENDASDPMDIKFDTFF